MYWMGLDAFVHCRCFRDGLATQPPVPATYGPDGLACDQSVSLEDDLAFDRWLETGCEHPETLSAAAHIGNWGTYRSFQTALTGVGPERFPNLIRELPNANGGATLPADAAKCLAELSAFQSSVGSWPRFHLIDADTGTVVATRVDAYDGVFLWSDHLEAGIAPDGVFFVRDPQDPTGEVLFSAREFIQRVVEVRQAPAIDLVELASDDGQRVTLSGGIVASGVDDTGGLEPLRLRVVMDTATTGSFVSVVSALREVFSASIENDMPVQWT